MIDKLIINNRFGEKLETVIRTQSISNKLPAIILVSGIGADLHETKNSHDEIAEILSNASFVTIQFSFAGRGRSEGVYEDMTLQRQAEQLKDVIDWMKSQKNVDSDKIGIYAMSFGVATTMSSDLRDIKSLCLVSGAYRPLESLKRLFEDKGEFNPNGVSWRKFSSGETIKLNPGFWTDIEKFDIQKLINKIKAPIFMIHGDGDRKIPVGEAKEIYELIKKPENQLKVIIGGDHGIIDVSKSVREEFLQNITEWFKSTL